MKYFSDERIRELMNKNRGTVTDLALSICNAFYGFYEYTSAFTDEENHNDLKNFEQVMNGLLSEDVERGELGKGLEMIFYDEETDYYYAIACKQIFIEEIKRKDELKTSLSILPPYVISATVRSTFIGAVDIDEHTELHMSTQQMISSDVIEILQEIDSPIPLPRFMTGLDAKDCNADNFLSKKDLCIQLNIMKIMELTSQCAYQTLLCSDDRIWMDNGNDDAVVYDYEQLSFALFMNEIVEMCTYILTYKEDDCRKTVIAKLQFALPFKQLSIDDRMGLKMLEHEITSKIPTKGAFLCGFDDEPEIIPQMFVTVEY